MTDQSTKEKHEMAYSWELSNAGDAKVRKMVQAWRIATATVYRALLAITALSMWAVVTMNEGWNARIIGGGVVLSVGIATATIIRLCMENEVCVWECESEKRADKVLRDG